jgi:crotonobetainyl-CoA:carnitine CoA-transferase CaiB-like acyl-CoA transferase
MGLEHLVDDPRFSTNDAQIEHTEEIMTIVREKFLELTAAEWLKRLEEEDIICGPVLSYQEIFSHPQVQANGMVVTLPHPDGAGEIRQVGIPVKLSRTPGEVRSPGPQLGQHTAEILKAAGYTEEQVDSFITSGLVGK